MKLPSIEEFKREFAAVPPICSRGRILGINGVLLKAELANSAIGDLVKVNTRNGIRLKAQVIGFEDQQVLLSPLGSSSDVVPGALVEGSCAPSTLTLSADLLGSVLDGLGNLHQRVATNPLEFSPVLSSFAGEPPTPLERKPLEKAFNTGIRAIDALCPLAQGQRLSVLAEPGVGKSTLLGMIARNTTADVNVIALIGERGREVGSWIEDLREAAKRTVIVFATSDQPAALRIEAAYLATRIAEYFRDQGLNVLLQLDSLTRLIRAMREIGLASGEPPVKQGYPLSVYSRIPKLIERTGRTSKGSITALYTLLLTSDFQEDPFVEEVKGLTDGHLVLKREFAERAHYPAIDVLSSLSRLDNKLYNETQREAAHTLRRALARIAAERELIALGGNPDEELKQYLQLEPMVLEFLQQSTSESASSTETFDALIEIAKQLTYHPP